MKTRLAIIATTRSFFKSKVDPNPFVFKLVSNEGSGTGDEWVNRFQIVIKAYEKGTSQLMDRIDKKMKDLKNNIIVEN